MRRRQWAILLLILLATLAVLISAVLLLSSSSSNANASVNHFLEVALVGVALLIIVILIALRPKERSVVYGLETLPSAAEATPSPDDAGAAVPAAKSTEAPPPEQADAIPAKKKAEAAESPSPEPQAPAPPASRSGSRLRRAEEQPAASAEAQSDRAAGSRPVVRGPDLLRRVDKETLEGSPRSAGTSRRVAEAHNEIKALIRLRLQQELGDTAPSDPQQRRAAIQELFATILAEEGILLSRSERGMLLDQILAEKLGQEAVLFSAHYVKEVRPQVWQPLKAYIFKDTASAEVAGDVREQLGDRADIRSTTRPAAQPVAEGALVTATPYADGFEFDPPSQAGRFRQDFRRFDFEFQAVDAPLDVAANGRVTFTVEGVIVADVPLSIYVSQSAGAIAAPQEQVARPYQAIFCSYSHKDTAIVERVEAAYRMLGIDYLRDVTTLRAGQHWDEELLNMIDRADIFQLFWSDHAKGSPYVEKEWRHALDLIEQATKDQTFIRPVRWQEPMPAPPPELGHIHFAFQPELGQ